MTMTSMQAVRDLRVALTAQDSDDESALAGWILYLRLGHSIHVQPQRARDLFIEAGLGEAAAPKGRTPSDAWRVATQALSGHEVETPHGQARILVRPWPDDSKVRHLTLESVSSEHFDYESPAAILRYDPHPDTPGTHFTWSNIIGYPALTGAILRAEEAFYSAQDVDGESIQRRLIELIMARSPLVLGQGSYLLWRNDPQSRDLRDGIVMLVDLLNEQYGGDASSAYYLSALGSERDGQNLSRAMLATLRQEADAQRERIAACLADPRRLTPSAARLEQERLDRLVQQYEYYRVQFKADLCDANVSLRSLEEGYEQLARETAMRQALREAAARQKKGEAAS